MYYDKRLPQTISPQPGDGATPEERERFLKNSKWNYRIIKPRKQLEVKMLIYVCDKIRPAWYNPEAGKKDYWRFLFIIKGKATVNSDGKEYILTDGMLISNFPMEFVELRECVGEELEFMEVFADIDGDMSYFLENKVLSLSSAEKGLFMSAVTALNIYYSYMGDLKYLQKGINLFEAFIVDILISADGKNNISRDPRYLEIIEILNKFCDRKMTLSLLSQECGMSVSLMKKIFFKNSDCGIMEYFNRIKIRRATELLDMGYTSTEVAKMLSYSGTEYFSYCFQREMGMSPRQYIKRK